MTNPPTTRPYVVLDPNTHARAASAFSWALRDDRANAAYYLTELTEAERDQVIRAAALLLAVAEPGSAS